MNLKFGALIKDQDLLYTIINQMWRIISGPLTMLAIPWFLTPVVQGYWYTFISLAAFSGMANLGFSTIIMQFSAHEFAFLEFDTCGKAIGEQEHLIKLACLFKFILKWMVVTVVTIFPLVIYYGWIFLSARSENVNWQFAWVLYSISTIWLFVNMSLCCFFQGCKSVAFIQSIELKGSVVATILNVVCLYMGMGLNTLVISTFARCLLVFILLIYTFKGLLSQFWSITRQNSYSWFKEFTSLMWRYVISWSSGMLMTQIFTPLAFNFYGPIFAGQIGFTMSLWSSAKWIVYSFFTSAIPKINIMVELQEWKKLNEFVKGRLIGVVSFYILGSTFFFVLYYMFHGSFFLFNRLAPLSITLAVCCNEFCTLIINSGAIYLRAFKEDPTMLVSAFVGVFIALTSYLIAKNMNSDYLFVGSLIAYICFSIPATIYLIKKKISNFKIL